MRCPFYKIPHLSGLFASAMLLCGCPSGAPQSQGGGSAAPAFKKPGCPSKGPSLKEIKRAKEELYQLIERSRKYTSEALRDESIKSYKNTIRVKEETECPAALLRYIKAIAGLH